MVTYLGTRQRLLLAAAGAAAVGLVGPASAPAFAAAPVDQVVFTDKGRDPQKQAQSDPDGNENGGVDQPGFSGGVNKQDQDGNNGSGNDSDCEDDNNGNGTPGSCKDKPQRGKSADKGKKGEAGDKDRGNKPDDAGTPANGAVEGEEDSGDSDDSDGGIDGASAGASDGASPGSGEVLGAEATAPGSGTGEGAAAAEGDDDSGFLGRAAAGILPDTGAGAAMMALALAGLGTAAAGGYILWRRRTAA